MAEETNSTANQIYAAGWIAAANWAGRPDLIEDTTSRAYEGQRDAALARITAQAEAGAVITRANELGQKLRAILTSVETDMRARRTSMYAGHPQMAEINSELSDVRSLLAALGEPQEPTND